MHIYSYQGKTPQIAPGVFVAPNATIIGDVVIGEGSSIWFGAVLRADFAPIRIGKNNSIQDNTVIHVSYGGTHIGDGNTIAHGVVLHNCVIGNNNVIGMNAVVLDDAVIGNECMVAAGSVIQQKAQFPDRQVIAGIPAQVKKELSGDALRWVERAAARYRELIENYGEGFRYQPGRE